MSAIIQQVNRTNPFNHTIETLDINGKWCVATAAPLKFDTIAEAKTWWLNHHTNYHSWRALEPFVRSTRKDARWHWLTTKVYIET